MPSETPSPLLELRGVSKSFARVRALVDVDLAVAPGEIHALLGENGAGKSTLVKIVYGMVAADRGVVMWKGQPTTMDNPSQARALGVGMVFQHFSLFETLTVAENIRLALPGKQKLDRLAERISQRSVHYGIAVEPHRHVHSLSVGERQRVEILRCLLQSPRLIIMDEPTSVLTPQATGQLFATLRQLADEGCSVLYISHKLEEIRKLCDRATVLRQGQVVGQVEAHSQSAGDLARLMIGHDPPGRSARKPPSVGPTQLVLERVSRTATNPFGCSLREINVELRGAEILGIAGVSGNGQRELLRVLSGEDPLGSADADRIRLDRSPVGHLGVGERRTRGLAVVPEERLGRGSVPMLALTQNTLLTAHRQGMVRAGLIAGRPVVEFTRRCIERFNVRCPGPNALAGGLSGGNLQKFLVGREILQHPRVLIAAQPTWGVDMGAATQIRQALIDLAAAGTAVLVISEDLDELLEICHRIAVLANGKLSPAEPVGRMSPERIGLLMGGVPDAPVDTPVDAGVSERAGASAV